MKIRIPNKIKVGGHWIGIFYEKKLFDNHGKYGQSRFPENEIALQDRDMVNSRKSQTLIHELLHFVDFVYNNCNLEENTVNALATGIHALLVDLGVEFDFSEINYK